MVRRLLLCTVLAALAACAATEADPPSLAHRDIEGIATRPMRGIAPVPSASDPALAARIAELIAQAEAGHAEFAATLPGTRASVAAAGAVESESWIRAHLDLSALDSSRNGTTLALGALDSILADQASAGSPAETDRLIAAREHVAELYAAQAESYGALLASLRSR